MTKQQKLFIYIIESPSAQEIYESKSEGFFISQAASLNQMNCITKNVVNKKLFFKAITTDLADSMKIFPGKLPIIHISAHGNKNGIATTSSDDIITWDLFHEMLTYINIFFKEISFYACQAVKDYTHTKWFVVK